MMPMKAASAWEGTAQDEETGCIVVRGPASLSNLGPGFDTLGVCITGYFDTVEVFPWDRPGVHILDSGMAALPSTPERNTAGVAAAEVLRRVAPERGVALRIRKGIPLGSGIGGSAASAVAAAWGVNALLGFPLTREDLVEAVLAGEAVASGSRHGDNVLPALFGGMVVVSASEPHAYFRISLSYPLHLALVLPEISVLTSEARRILPPQIPLRDAVANASDLAMMLAAFQAGDLETAGRLLMRDRLVEPVRARLIPCYAAVRQAALEAGALGCAITGSGPAMFALAPDAATASRVAEAMAQACREAGIAASGQAVMLNPRGVILESEP